MSIKIAKTLYFFQNNGKDIFQNMRQEGRKYLGWGGLETCTLFELLLKRANSQKERILVPFVDFQGT